MFFFFFSLAIIRCSKNVLLNMSQRTCSNADIVSKLLYFHVVCIFTFSNHSISFPCKTRIFQNRAIVLFPLGSVLLKVDIGKLTKIFVYFCSPIFQCEQLFFSSLDWNEKENDFTSHAGKLRFWRVLVTSLALGSRINPHSSKTSWIHSIVKYC